MARVISLLTFVTQKLCHFISNVAEVLESMSVRVPLEAIAKKLTFLLAAKAKPSGAKEEVRAMCAGGSKRGGRRNELSGWRFLGESSSTCSGSIGKDDDSEKVEAFLRRMKSSLTKTFLLIPDSRFG